MFTRADAAYTADRLVHIFPTLQSHFGPTAGVALLFEQRYHIVELTWLSIRPMTLTWYSSSARSIVELQPEPTSSSVMPACRSHLPNVRSTPRLRYLGRHVVEFEIGAAISPRRVQEEFEQLVRQIEMGSEVVIEKGGVI